MYLDFYQLKTKPFQITADPRFLWLGEKHKEALATLRYGIVDNRGFLLLTGEVGTGKTILINRITTLLDIDTVVATLPDPDLESMDFYNLLADGLNMKRTFESKGAFLIHLRDFLHQSYANQQQVLLIIDESQRLNSKLMEDIRVLSNIELHDRKLINIFFVGQQEFNSILMTPQNRALAQRITVRYHIEALDQQETGEYIKHRLMVAGRKTPIFKEKALQEIYHFSGGIPRLINIISDHALLTGYAQSVQRITGEVIKECAEELRIPIQKPQSDVATLRSPLENQVPAAKQSKSDKDNQPPAPIVPSNTPATGEQMPKKEKEPPAAWKLANVIMILLLIATVVYAVNQFSGGETRQYDESELTPKKYKTSLEKEKELLSDRLEQSEAMEAGENERSSAELEENRATSSTSLSSKPTEENEEMVPSGQEVTSEEPLPDIQTDPVEATEAEALKTDTATGEMEIPIATDEQESEPGTDEKRDLAAADEIASETAEVVNSVPMTTDGSTLEAKLDEKKIEIPKDEQRVEIEPLPLMDEAIVIQFAINSNEIDTESYEILDRVSVYLVRNPEKKIYVRGYTDASGSQGYNASVSRFRASVVKTYLIGKGVYPQNVEVFAMGSANPVASNDTYAGRRLNRRVEIEFSADLSGNP